MLTRLFNLLTGKTCKAPAEAPPLPKGLQAAAPLTNEKLQRLLTAEDISTSGGIHTVVDGSPVLAGHVVGR